MAKVAIRSIFVLMAIILMAVWLYQRLWVVQMELNSERRKSDMYQKFYNEALDETADWRKKYDQDKDINMQRLQQMNDKIWETEHKLQLLQENNLKLEQERVKLVEEIKRLKRSD